MDHPNLLLKSISVALSFLVTGGQHAARAMNIQGRESVHVIKQN